MSSALASKTDITKMDKKIQYSNGNLQRSVCWFPEDKEFIDEKCSKENISIVEVTYFSWASQAKHYSMCSVKF